MNPRLARRLLAVPSALAVVAFLVTGATSASASVQAHVLSAASHVAPDTSGAPECKNYGSGQCMAARLGELGVAVYVYPDDEPPADPYEDITRPVLTNMCDNGVVTDNCPSLPDGDEVYYAGDNIVNLKFADLGNQGFGNGPWCVGFHFNFSDANGIVQHCSGSDAVGTTVIAVPDGTGLEFLDVRMSNENNGALCFIDGPDNGVLNACDSIGNWEHP